MHITIKIQPPAIYETIDVYDGCEKPDQYALEVAAERYADMLRGGDPFDLLYEGSTFVKQENPYGHIQR